MTIVADARLEYRLRSDAKRRIEQAAELVHESTSDFARAAAEQRAEQVLAEHSWRVTVVPSEFFDELLAALDDPPRANAALKAAAIRAKTEVERR